MNYLYYFLPIVLLWAFLRDSYLLYATWRANIVHQQLFIMMEEVILLECVRLNSLPPNSKAIGALKRDC